MRHLVPISLCLLSSLVAQTATSPSTFGLTTHEGVLHGLGPNYSARFDARGVTFTPALGAAAAAPATLHVAFASVRRGDTVVCARTHDCEPVAVGDTVRYVHGPDVTEVHTVRADGIEQSFVFAERPRGRGDLVVRCRITTALPLAQATDDGVRFERAGVGGVAFGAVTGIDANGARCRGSLRCDGAMLELVLPASFVDTAAYPLVLDPLIGSAFLIANVAGGSDVQPSMAFDNGNQRWLVVWNVPMSATTAEVRGQFVSAAGFVGPQFLFDTLGLPGVRPAVASLNAYNRFVVAWARTSLVRFECINAASGSTIGIASWGVAPLELTGLALGGDSRATTPFTFVDALCVITVRDTSTSLSSALRRLVRVPLSGLVSLQAVTTIYNLPVTSGPPSVSKHAGALGRWMCAIAWRSQISSTTFGITCEAVDASGTCASQTWNWTGPAVAFPLHSSIATRDGQKFFVAWENGASSIAARRITVSSCGSPLTLGAEFDPAGFLGSDDHPEVDCTGDRWVLAWRYSVSGTPNARVRSLGLVSGEGAVVYADGPSASAQVDPTVCARWSGGDSSDEALVAWASAGIRARRWEATGTGTIANLGGGCGISGLNDFASYTGAPLIGTTLTLELIAPTAPVLGLIVGFSPAPLACGPCTLVPSVDVLVGGSGPVPIAVPFDPSFLGAELFAQWLQWRQAGCPLASDYGVSNTLKFTFAE